MGSDRIFGSHPSAPRLVRLTLDGPGPLSGAYGVRLRLNTVGGLNCGLGFVLGVSSHGGTTVSCYGGCLRR